ncbi:MAG: XdhC family protein [Planctomycetota bacterium]|jgi:xanthine dehydrogenase accessory factor
MSESPASLLRRAAALEREGRRVVACLVVKARGSTPQSAGALMLVDDLARTWGTIGGGCVEAEVRQKAHALLGESGGGHLRFRLDHDYGWDDGLICGGTMELAVAPLPPAAALAGAIETLDARRPASVDLTVPGADGPARWTLTITPPARLYVAGAGHVGRAVSRLARRLDFAVTLFDDRPALLEPAGGDGVDTVAGDIAGGLRAAPVGPDTYCLVVTRGHRHDEQALEAVADRGAAYVGMIGSRRKVKVILDDLAERGVPRSALESVHAPVGLEIGAVTVEEIAVSIAAQLVAVRRRSTPTPVTGPHAEPADAAPAPTS